MIAAAVMGLGLAGTAPAQQSGNATNAQPVVDDPAAVEEVTSPPPIPDTIPVAMLLDASTGQVLFSREPDRRFMPASVTKVMTAFTAFRLIDEGKIEPSRRFLYTQELEDEWYNEGSNMFLEAGDRPTFGELLLGATTVSGNDASVAIAIAATGSLENWLELMNENAADLGMRNTHFGGANGFPDEGKTFTSAADLARLGEAMVTRYPGLYKRYFGHRTLKWNEITQANHDPVTGRVEGGDGMKTGFTNEAGYTFLGSAERNGRRLIVVIAASPTARERDKAARDMLEWGFDEFDQRRFLPATAKVGDALVQEGSSDTVALLAPEGVRLTLPKGPHGPITTRIVYRGPIEAPISKDEEIASLRIAVDGEDMLDVPLVAGEDIGRAGPFRRVRNAILHWLT